MLGIQLLNLTTLGKIPFVVYWDDRAPVPESVPDILMSPACKGISPSKTAELNSGGDDHVYFDILSSLEVIEDEWSEYRPEPEEIEEAVIQHVYA